MAEDKSSKTQKATPKKKRDAKRKGQVAKSQDVGIAAGVIAAFSVLFLMADNFLERLYAMMHNTFEWLKNPEDLVEDPAAVFLSALTDVAYISLPIMFAVLAIGFSAQLGQVGFLVTGEQMKPKFSKINPVNGLKRWFAIRSLVELGKSLAKLVVIFALGALVIWGLIDELIASPWLSVAEIVSLGGKIVAALFWRILPLLVAIAVLDYMFQRWQWERDLRMSMKDLKDEFKNTEGDPYMKQARKQFHQQLSNQQSTEAVPEADATVINPTEFAVSIKYEPQLHAVPIVVAKGDTRTADEIRRKSHDNDVPVIRNKPLARALYAQCEIGEPVPGDLYRPVAEVLAYVFALDAENAPAAGPDGVHEPDGQQSAAQAQPSPTQGAPALASHAGTPISTPHGGEWS